MKRDRLKLAAAPLLLGLSVLALALSSHAGEKKDDKDPVKDVKFACSQHGPSFMNLTLSLKKGTARTVEFIGGNDFMKWQVKIDGKDVSIDNGKTAEVFSGDTITWSVNSTNCAQHGVVFAEKALAQALIEFDMKAGKPLVDQNKKLSSGAWKKFGSDRWGTDPTDTAGVLATGKVK